tara:strand:+ start:1292 stop:2215 length:924 start_codon:yes stop_codon:yes gene_type:complete
MNNNKIILILIFILSGLASLSQFKRFISSQQQYEMWFDLEQDRFSRPIDFVEKIENNYPNLTYIGVPLSALKGSYYAGLDSIDLAKKLYYKSMIDHPFLMYGEQRMSELYYNINQMDSMTYYANKAIMGLPNNAKHFYLKILSLKYEQKGDSMIYYFNKIDQKVKKSDHALWRIVLAGIYEDNKVEKEDAKDLAVESKKVFPYDNEINLISEWILYSREIANNSLRNYNRIMKMEDTYVSYKDSIFSEIINQVPTNQKYFENYIAFLLRTRNNTKAKEIFKNRSNNFSKINPVILDAMNQNGERNED